MEPGPAFPVPPGVVGVYAHGQVHQLPQHGDGAGVVRMGVGKDDGAQLRGVSPQALDVSEYLPAIEGEGRVHKHHVASRHSRFPPGKP